MNLAIRHERIRRGCRRCQFDRDRPTTHNLSRNHSTYRNQAQGVKIDRKEESHASSCSRVVLNYINNRGEPEDCGRMDSHSYGNGHIH